MWLERLGWYAWIAVGRNKSMYSKKERKLVRKKGIYHELITALKIDKKELPHSLLKLPVERI